MLGFSAGRCLVSPCIVTNSGSLSRTLDHHTTCRGSETSPPISELHLANVQVSVQLFVLSLSLQIIVQTMIILFFFVPPPFYLSHPCHS